MNRSPLPRQAHLDFLDKVRVFELHKAMKFFPSVGLGEKVYQIMELGSGTGKQAKILSDAGYEVVALDVDSSSYRSVRCFDVVEYDGKSIPLPSLSQDVVFSSNVLEHVVDLDDVLSETCRVLRDGGVCVHLIPTPSCRFWTLFAHYLWFARRILQRVILSKGNANALDFPRAPTTFKSLIWTLFPPKHGERGNTISEMYYYSTRFWVGKFESSGFEVDVLESNDLFYTMANSLGSYLSISSRQFLSRLFGSACRVYVLKKKARIDG
ncbi:class I SAM-dependent methyltransferase [Halopseudomonas oceani]|uniref:class I SAM-dependent methyltransferase n=1 Tax=Halopseudomonas oceani TaxID=1708783 RepID=UPI002AA65D2E|nr:class I SAM-dependent methyltransferase [Halopseudomonas oceani]